MIPTAIPDNHFASLANLEGGYWWFVARVAWARRLVAPWYQKQKQNPLVYADLGCGTGGFAKSLDDFFGFSKVVLVDGDPNALKRIHFPKANVVSSDLGPSLSLPHTPQLISLMDVIEHVADDEALVAKAAKLLAPGGLLLISVPAHQILFSSWDRQLGHHRRYSRDRLEEIVTKAGLKVTTLRSMWSFLFLPAFIRKFENRTKDNMEFPPVSPALNSVMVQLSHFEWNLPAWMRLPFGTSWIVAAEKP